MTVAVRAATPSSDEVEAIHDAAERLVALWARSYETAEGRVSPSQLRVLLAVFDGSPITVTALADELAAMVSSVTRLCDRLVAVGYIDRETSPASRRQVLITLTVHGERLLDEIRARRLAELAALVRKLNKAERVALLTGLRAVQRVGAGDRVRRHP